MWYCCTFILILQKTGEIREVTEFWDSDEGSVSPDEGSVTPDKGSLCLTSTTFYLTRINLDLATDETQNLSDPYRKAEYQPVQGRIRQIRKQNLNWKQDQLKEGRPEKLISEISCTREIILEQRSIPRVWDWRLLLGGEVEKQKTRVLLWIFFFFGFYHDFSLSHLFYLL